ncbi:MAG: undecaprenyl/decaprenyl-phosphate alpha-N-acetylglucosaminyl 1-phosphate transferase [Treponema sp.]|jgi:UDP-GlcNAc:undecaprenyl-phosphate GlcNAc-1-phosphate transferase|nr:undecaprenyl/decaprenyl-phosphate alpha-N-acetylglucosaminyl 1-phosphate transferase [Treponema sp.]
MTGIAIIFSASVFFSVVAVGLILRLSHKKSWYDHTGERKIHNGHVPRLGGIGFALVFIIIAAIISFSTRKVEYTFRFLPCLSALIITLVYGVWDDFRPLLSWHKLLLQFIGALCIIFSGFTFRRIVYFDAGLFSNLGWLAYPITCLWLVGLANAINFIDGVDGLAGGLSAIIAVFFALIFFSYAETPSAELFCICLTGVTLGFLVFNLPLPKAKIFMGDSGSQFLGFALAMLPLLEEHDTIAALPVPYAAALLAIPIFDIIAAVWRRLRDGRRLDSPDTAHIHHKLMNIGLSARGVDAVLYGLQILLGILVYISIQLPGILSLGVLGIAYVVAIVFFAVIHFWNRKVLSKGREEGRLLTSTE